MLNQRGPIDTRKVLTGKDGALYNDAGVMLATVESFQAQVNVTNAKYHRSATRRSTKPSRLTP